MSYIVEKNSEGKFAIIEPRGSSYGSAMLLGTRDAEPEAISYAVQRYINFERHRPDCKILISYETVTGRDGVERTIVKIGKPKVSSFTAED